MVDFPIDGNVKRFVTILGRLSSALSCVIPAQAGIQDYHAILDSGLCRSDAAGGTASSRVRSSSGVTKRLGMMELQLTGNRRLR
jgi:hypothetical protein